MDLDLFLDMLNIDSTSSHEGSFADYLEAKLRCEGCTVTRYPEDAHRSEPVNLLLAWGKPEIVFCTHLDTVPPYIPPTVETDGDDTIIRGRGACDAKGQIFAMYSACRGLASRGCKGFGLLLLYGEETGSYGAKAYRNYPGGKFVIVGEPTDGCMVSASKGTKAFELSLHGRSFHSGYPQYGESAIEHFVDLVNDLRAIDFPIDDVLGDTTYNIGKLVSDNPQNILSDCLSCRIYFRTTFASDSMVSEVMETLASHHKADLQALGGDTPMRYLTLPGFETKVVAFGSDAPQLTNFEHKILCGPGSILVAHRPDEFITLSELRQAKDNYIRMYEILSKQLN